MMPQKSRRSFLKETAFGGAILGLSPMAHRSIFAAQPPSERVRVGMIGVGNQGGPKNNMKYFLKNIVALCDLDKTIWQKQEIFCRRKRGSPLGRRTITADCSTPRKWMQS